MDISTIWWVLRTLFTSVKEGGELMEKGGKLVEGGRAIAEQIVKWGRGLVGADEKEIEEDLKTRRLVLDNLPEEIKRELEKSGVKEPLNFTQLPEEVQRAIVEFLSQKVNSVQTIQEWRERSGEFERELMERLAEVVKGVEYKSDNRAFNQNGSIWGDGNNTLQVQAGDNANITINPQIGSSPKKKFH